MVVLVREASARGDERPQTTPMSRVSAIRGVLQRAFHQLHRYGFGCAGAQSYSGCDMDPQLAPVGKQVEPRSVGQLDLPRAVRVHHEELESSTHQPVEHDLLVIG